MKRLKVRSRYLLVLLLIMTATLVGLASAEEVKPVKTLKPDQTNVTLNVGDTVTPQITVKPEDASNQDYILTSSDEKVVTVDGKNLIAVGGGKAVVTVTPADGSKAKAKINVYVPTIAGPAQTEYTINSLSNLQIPLSYYGSDFASNVQIKIKNSKIISVSPKLNGTTLTLDVSPMKAGDTAITISDKKDSKASRTIKVIVTADAIPNARKITITQAKQTRWGINVGLSNGTDDPISDVEFAILLYDENGRLLQPQDKSVSKWKDFADKVKLIETGYSSRMKAGKNGKVTLYLDNTIRSMKFSRIDLAVAGYKPDVQIDFTDVPSVLIPECQWQWFSTAAKGYTSTPEASYNYLPPELKNHTTYGIRGEIGYNVYFYSLYGMYLTKEYAKLNGFHHAGAWIYDVSSNWDKLYDVQVGDLIWGVDEIEYVNEPMLADLFQEEFTEDWDHPKSFVIHLERNGVDHDITVNYRDYYDESTGKARYFETKQ